ncbi:MAG: DUF2927 domain-containing protein [Eubacteriales bacterium]|nr:DUF2927 domain-containing protein [Eubacteriales bacterium]
MNKKIFSPLALLLVSLLLLTSLFSACNLEEITKEDLELPEEEAEVISPDESVAPEEETAEPEISEEVFDYYQKLAMCFEDDLQSARIKRWPASEIRVAVNDKASTEDYEAIEKLLSDITSIPGLPQFILVEEDAEELDHEKNSLVIYYETKAEIEKILELTDFQVYQWYINWGIKPAFEFTDAAIFLNTEDTVEKREFGLRKAFLQMLGLLNNDVRNKELALDRNSEIIELSELDKQILELHYRPEIRPNMLVTEAVADLKAIYLEGADPSEIKAKNTPSEKELEAEKEANIDYIPDESTEELWKSLGVTPRHAEIIEQDFYAQRKDIDPEFFERALEYFEEVVGYGEFDSTYDGYVHKWSNEREISVSMLGDYEDWDLETMENLLAQLNNIPNMPEFKLKAEADETADIVIHFLPLKEMHEVIGSDMLSEWGIFFYQWDSSFETISAKIGIATDVNTKNSRRHLLQEEFIQCLGLINDSYEYADSIFQQEWTTVQYPNELDWLLVEMLYRPEITAEMPIDEAIETLRGLYLD